MSRFAVVLAATFFAFPYAVLSQTETILHNFAGPEGNAPSGGLIQANDGNFYGGTTFGGTQGSTDYNDGVVYKVNATGTSFSDVYVFKNGADGEQPEGAMLQGNDGYIYGTTAFSVFKLSAAGAITVLGSPGGNPSGLITASDGNYYLDSSFGSTVYKITASTGAVTALCTAPGFSLSGVVQAGDGNLYGTELGGGTGGAQSIFKCTLGGTVSVFYTFPTNTIPDSALVVGADGQLYGFLSNDDDTGVQFYKISTSSANVTTVATIPDADNLQPPGTPILASDGNFYAVAQGTGDERYLVKVTPGGTVTLPFTISNPGELNSPLVQGSDGALYGTGANEGTDSDGAVYKIAFTPALPAPVTLSLGASSIVQGNSTKLSWSVAGVYGGSAAYCVAGGNDPEWTGVKATSGQVTLTPAAVGAYTYTLSCGGTISNSTSLTVTSNGKVNTTTALTVSPNPITIGNSGTLTATVSPATGATIPAGTVTFSTGSFVLGTQSLTSGVATIKPSTAGQQPGTYPVIARYNGSSGFNTSASNTVNVVLTNKVATTVTVVVQPDEFVEGSMATISATVKAVSGSGTPGGSVAFSSGSLSLGSYNLNGSGVASFTVSSSGVAPGTYTVNASYAGSSAYLSSSGSKAAVIQWPTTTTLSASPNPVVAGSPTTITALVSRTGSSGNATGTVTFFYGSTNLGNAILSGGTASITTSALPQGSDKVTASYAGDNNDGSSASAPYTITVN